MKPLNPRLMIPTGNLAHWQDTGAPFMPSENADDDTIRHRVREAGNRAFAIIEPKLTLMRLMTNALAGESQCTADKRLKPIRTTGLNTNARIQPTIPV